MSLVAPQPLTAEQKGELLVISGSVADKAAHDKFFDQLYSFTDRRNVRDQTYLSPDSTPPGETFNILFRDGLQFASGQAKLDNATAQLALDGLAQLLLARPQAQVTIEGHTDNVGTPGYNLKLSAQRIQATLDYLKTKGVDIARLTVIARGESIPIADNATALGRLANRRIEVTITGLLNG